MIPPTIVRSGDLLILGEATLPVPPLARRGERGPSYGRCAGVSVAVWRVFTGADPERERGLLLECPNGAGLVLHILPDQARQHIAIGPWWPKAGDPLEGETGSTPRLFGPAEIAHHLARIAATPDDVWEERP